MAEQFDCHRYGLGCSASQQSNTIGRSTFCLLDWAQRSADSSEPSEKGYQNDGMELVPEKEKNDGNIRGESWQQQQPYQSVPEKNLCVCGDEKKIFLRWDSCG